MPRKRTPDPETTQDALGRAQDLAWDAFDEDDQDRRVALAMRAVAISPLCADGWGVLAQAAESPEAKLDLCRRAVAAGAEALGPEAFSRDAGMFWLVLETRPYMRAMNSLALVLWETGDSGPRQEAIGLWQEMLRLCPNDNIGVRYLLLDALLALGRDKPAAALLKRYRGDGAAWWPYGQALLAYRENGDSPEARRALSAAFAANPYVPPLLLAGAPRLELPYFGRGEESEALAYLRSAAEGWRNTPGAIQWMTGTSGGRPPAPRRRRVRR